MLEKNADQALAKDRNPVNRKARVLNRLYATLYRIDRTLDERFLVDTYNHMAATDAERYRRDLILERIDKVEAINV